MLGKKVENFIGTTKIQHSYPPPKEKNLGPPHLIGCKKFFFAYMCSLPFLT
jgi:hypothetical protein